jgi:hypothetical protein
MPAMWRLITAAIAVGPKPASSSATGVTPMIATMAVCPTTIAPIAARSGRIDSSSLSGRTRRLATDGASSTASCCGSGRSAVVTITPRSANAGMVTQASPGDPKTCSMIATSGAPPMAPIVPAETTTPTTRPRRSEGTMSAAATRPSSAAP